VSILLFSIFSVNSVSHWGIYIDSFPGRLMYRNCLLSQVWYWCTLLTLQCQSVVPTFV